MTHCGPLVQLAADYQIKRELKGIISLQNEPPALKISVYSFYSHRNGE